MSIFLSSNPYFPISEWWGSEKTRLARSFVITGSELLASPALSQRVRECQGVSPFLNAVGCKRLAQSRLLNGAPLGFSNTITIDYKAARCKSKSTFFKNGFAGEIKSLLKQRGWAQICMDSKVVRADFGSGLICPRLKHAAR